MKKRAAEATRRKTHDSFAATQLNTQDRHTRTEHVLLPEVKSTYLSCVKYYSVASQAHHTTLRVKTQSFLLPFGVLKCLQGGGFMDMDELGFFLFMEEQERKENEQQEEQDDANSGG